jgi:2-dehydropantoate 2-reductase
MTRVADILSRAGIEARCVPALRDTLWTKILANLTSNPLSVVSGATLDAIYGDARLLPIVRRMLQEGLALAAAYGARIPFDPASFIAEGAGMGPIRTSMLQDHLAGRPLELAAIGDAVLELARLQEIAMPVTARMIALAHFREEVATHPTQLAAA